MFTRMKFHQTVTIVVMLAMLLSTMQPNSASAQGGDGIKHQVNAESGRLSFIGPESGRALSASSALGTFLRPQDPALALAKRFAPEFGLKNPERDLSEIKADRSEDGRVTVRYQQNYGGIPVMGGELIVNTNEDGDLYSMNGEISPDLSVPTQPTIDSTQAAETALQAMAKWYEKTSADFVTSEPELWIYDESLLQPSTRPVELVWRMEVTATYTSLPVRELVLINSQRGSISLHFNQVDTSWHLTSKKNENNTSTLSNRAGKAILGSPLVSTYTANNGTSLPGSFLCNQTQPNCTNGDNPDADAAHKYAIGTYDFYSNNFNRDSMDNNGMTIVSTVHYDSGYANAFWSGEQMVYGDGYGFPLADDIVAHELTHGVTQYESNLFYYYQSGAINESFSDLWGEYYDQSNGLGNDTPGVKWLIGEDVSGLGDIRNMQNPPVYGDPDKMSSPNYYEGSGDNGGVHYNSGVNNKAVYLMVDGGTFNGKTVTALDWEKTGAIYYEAQTNLLASGSDYSDLYYALQQACMNLVGQYGIVEGDCTEVKDAVDAVEMNGQPAPNFNTDAPLCSATGTVPNIVFSDDLESGISNWTFNNGAYTRWQLDSEFWGVYAKSGLHSLYADDFPDLVTDARAQLAPQVIPSNAYLHFAHAYDFETDAPTYWDGGVIEYSKNGGSTWIDAGSLIDYNGYDGKIYTGADNPLSGRSAFAGASHGYISTRLNLSSLAGQTVAFRWRMGLDQAAYALGWWVDDIKIYNCIWEISGNVGAAGTTLSYTDGAAKTTASQVDGSYSLAVSNNWSGTVTPSHPCFNFNPTSRSYSNVTEDLVNQDYSAIPNPSLVCVLSITRTAPNPISADNVDFNVTFTKAVNGVDVSDFVLTAAGVSGASVTSVSDSGNHISYIVTVDTGSGNGTLRLDIMDDDSIKDTSNNPLGGVGAGNGDFTNGQTYQIINEPTFGDVPASHAYWQHIEILYANGLTNGCSTVPLKYCPSAIMNRAQVAKFFMTVQFGGSYLPPAGTKLVFKDSWKINPWAKLWANDMYAKGLTSGCKASPLLYCPDNQVIREQVAKFGLAIKYGNAYLPPPATGTVFADLTDVNYWATAWAEQAYADGLVPACGMSGGKPKFCPYGKVDRGFAAFVIVTATGLLGP